MKKYSLISAAPSALPFNSALARAVVLAAVVSAFAPLVSAQIWDPTQDFSVMDGNPNGVWTYARANADFTAFTPQEVPVTNAIAIGWENPSATLSIWRNESGGTLYGAPSGWMSLHPSSSNGAVLRWTSPVTGVVNVSGEFLPGDSSVVALGIFEGNSSIEVPLWSGSNAGSFNFNVSVSAGDVLNFAVWGTGISANTPLSLAIEAVPEPSIVALFFTAGVFLFARRRPSGDLRREIASPPAP